MAVGCDVQVAQVFHVLAGKQPDGRALLQVEEVVYGALGIFLLARIVQVTRVTLQTVGL